MGQGDAGTTCMCKDGELACSADTPEVLKVTASGSTEPSTECATLSGTPLTTSSQNLLQGFTMDTTATGADMMLTLSNCDYYMGHHLSSNYVIKYDFYNFGTYSVTLGDGSVDYQMSQGPWEKEPAASPPDSYNCNFCQIEVRQFRRIRNPLRLPCWNALASAAAVSCFCTR
eukprot:s2320_g7.t1